MPDHTQRIGRRSLAVAGSGAIALLGLTADQAMASYSAQIRGGTVQVTGNRDSDKLALRLKPGAPTTLQVDVGADGTADFSFDRNAFTAINVEAGAGDDEVVVDQNGGAFTDESLTIEGGAGDDLLSGGDGDDSTAGQAGHDVMDFNGSNALENIDIFRNGSRMRLQRHVASITMDFDGIEGVAVRALGGADTITVDDLGRTGVETADVDLAAIGGGGDGQPDTVIANGTNRPDAVAVTRSGLQVLTTGLPAQTRITGSEAALDSLRVNTLGGNDAVTVAPDVSDLIAPLVDLGIGG